MDSGELPRFMVRALPPIGRREPGNTFPQLARALAIIGVAVALAAAAGASKHPRAMASISVPMAERG